MIRNLITFFALAMCINSNAQIHEIGVTIGGANHIGDVGATDYIAPKELGFGIQYRWNRSPRHSWRASYTYMGISGNDAKSDMGSRRLRNLSFENRIHEASLGIEFNFFEFDLHNEWFAFTPYIYTGLAGFKFDETYFNKTNTQVKYGNGYSMAIPLHVGVKALINKRFVLSAEVGARYTFTDNLDGNHPKDASYTSNQFGNLQSKDWYVFTGLSLAYTFGKNPCYCAPN